ncbi:MAG: polymerase [Verrucomicrobiota bacterium]|jgi:DNA polymerase-1
MLIVDGHAYAYRSFHAIRQLSSPSGAPTNAIFGFIKALGRMQTLLAPSHVVVVWDGGLHAQRMEQLPDYKAQRPPMPDSLEKQLDGITHFLHAAGLASLCAEGIEADDWIAVIARRFSKQVPVVIASADKDFMQLVSPTVGLLNPNDKSEKLWTAEDVRAKAGVVPEQIVDWLSLIGDSVDNIPGVPGVGPKTASDLLNQFGSIDSLYSRLAEVKSDRLRIGLQTAESAVRRNQLLIRLRDDVPEVALDELIPRAADTERLRGLFTEWGFKGMLAALSTPALAQGDLL